MPFQVLNEFSPGAPAGVCFTCKASLRAGDLVVDCDYDVEALNASCATEIQGMAFELASGPLQVCSTCVFEMGRLLGMASTEEVELVAHATLQAISENEAVSAQVEDLEAKVRAYQLILGEGSAK